jgi:hypothetical protein
MSVHGEYEDEHDFRISEFTLNGDFPSRRVFPTG